MASLKDKVAIITGAGRGIGAATAKLFAAEGARVVLASRTKSQIESVAQEIEKKQGKGRTLVIPTDVADEASVKNLFAQTLKVFGGFDILINNAAVVTVADFERFDTQALDEMLGVNVRGAMLCAREAFQALRRLKHGGSIVNLSSLGGIRGTQKFKGMSAYVVSKHAIVGLTESLAVEGRELSIRVNCVAPGAVDTEMLKKAAPFLKTDTKPEDVARTILFLSDEAQSRALTGAILEIHSNL